MENTNTTTATPAKDDQKLIDKIVYLSSLTSVQSDIDPMMDTLRLITARWQPPQPLPPEDRESLSTLQRKLEDYLINHDPLRSFTSESLQKRLDEYQKGTWRSRLRYFILSLVASLAVAIITYVLPLDLPQQTHLYVSESLFFLTLSVATIWFYTSALRNFKDEFKQAFIYILMGVIMLSTFYITTSILHVLRLEEYDAFRYAGIPGTVTISFILIYFGLRTYAKLLNLKTPFASLPLILGVMLFVATVAALIPHPQPVRNEFYFDISLVSIWLLPTVIIFCAGMAYKVKKSVTKTYSRSLNLFFWYFILGGFGALGSATSLYLLGEIQGPVLSILELAGGFAPQIFLLYTGYSFKEQTSK